MGAPSVSNSAQRAGWILRVSVQNWEREQHLNNISFLVQLLQFPNLLSMAQMWICCIGGNELCINRKILLSVFLRGVSAKADSRSSWKTWGFDSSFARSILPLCSHCVKLWSWHLLWQYFRFGMSSILIHFVEWLSWKKCTLFHSVTLYILQFAGKLFSISIFKLQFLFYKQQVVLRIGDGGETRRLRAKKDFVEDAA